MAEGLTARERDYFDKLETIGAWISRRINRAECIIRIQETWPTNEKGPDDQLLPMPTSRAAKWYQKALDYLREGHREDTALLRNLYSRSLEDAMMEIREHFVVEVKETTYEPANTAAGNTTPASGSKPKLRVAKMKTKRVAQPSVVDAWLKLGKEWAKINGIRESDAPETSDPDAPKSASEVARLTPQQLVDIMMNGARVVGDTTAVAMLPRKVDNEAASGPNPSG